MLSPNATNLVALRCEAFGGAGVGTGDALRCTLPHAAANMAKEINTNLAFKALFDDVEEGVGDLLVTRLSGMQSIRPD